MRCAEQLSDSCTWCVACLTYRWLQIVQCVKRNAVTPPDVQRTAHALPTGATRPPPCLPCTTHLHFFKLHCPQQRSNDINASMAAAGPSSIAIASPTTAHVDPPPERNRKHCMYETAPAQGGSYRQGATRLRILALHTGSSDIQQRPISQTVLLQSNPIALGCPCVVCNPRKHPSPAHTTDTVQAGKTPACIPTHPCPTIAAAATCSRPTLPRRPNRICMHE